MACQSVFQAKTKAIFFPIESGPQLTDTPSVPPSWTPSFNPTLLSLRAGGDRTSGFRFPVSRLKQRRSIDVKDAQKIMSLVSVRTVGAEPPFLPLNIARRSGRRAATTRRKYRPVVAGAVATGSIERLPSIKVLLITQIIRNGWNPFRSVARTVVIQGNRSKTRWPDTLNAASLIAISYFYRSAEREDSAQHNHALASLISEK